MLMHLERNPEDQKPAEAKRRYRTLGNLAIGLAIAGGLIAYGFTGSEISGPIELPVIIPMAIITGAVAFFVLQKSRGNSQR